MKADVITKRCLSWSEAGCSVSEAVFVEKPGATKEDEGKLYQYGCLLLLFVAFTSIWML